MKLNPFFFVCFRLRQRSNFARCSEGLFGCAWLALGLFQVSMAVAGPHLVDDYSPRIGDLVNVVVEIPAGTNEKWEADKSTGQLLLESVDGKPRVVAYLGYPGNYGFVPQTLLPKAKGGDGDPLDVVLIGQPVKRGKVVAGRLVGVLKLTDDGEQDDKLIAVMPGTAFAHVKSLMELDEQFPGVSGILKTWFINYKGVGKMTFQGFGGPGAAQALLTTAATAYREAH